MNVSISIFFFLHLHRPALEPEVIYLRHVERAKPFIPVTEEDRVYPPPQFIVPLRDMSQMEGGKVHFEARIEPVGDLHVGIECLSLERELLLDLDLDLRTHGALRVREGGQRGDAQRNQGNRAQANACTRSARRCAPQPRQGAYAYGRAPRRLEITVSRATGGSTTRTNAI